MDISKLTPAPWSWDGDDNDPSIEGNGGCVAHVQCHGNINTVAREGQQYSHADADFIAIARNAFDVMMRRGWGVTCDRLKSQFCALEESGWFDDPFSALVEADKWYTENVEKI